jgi:hypothetical protein
MVAGLRLVLRHLLLRVDARFHALVVSPGSPASSTGFHQSLVLVFPKYNNRSKESTAQNYSLISINQSNELSTNTGQQDACNDFMI